MLDLGFPETSYFLHFIGGTKGKKIKNCKSPPKSGSSFLNRDPQRIEVQAQIQILIFVDRSSKFEKLIECHELEIQVDHCLS